MQQPILVRFRQDLRISDNPALTAAAAGGRPVLPVHVLDEAELGGTARWWLHRSLAALRVALAAQGLPLVLRRGLPGPVLAGLAAETGAAGVYWNRSREPAARQGDAVLAGELAAAGLEVRCFEAALLVEPGALTTASGRPFQVFAPFFRALRAAGPPAPLPPPGRLVPPARIPASIPARTPAGIGRGGDQDSREGRTAGLAAQWVPGEAAAWRRLTAFLSGAAGHYRDGRDRPDREATSRLSPHLHWGEIGPRQVWHAALAARETQGGADLDPFLRQLAWREFCAHLLHHYPTLPAQPLRPAFAGFPWATDLALQHAWQRGATGYPMVDAGMRQLWHTGWMHNRVRMIAASFLVKHLLQPWQSGEAWFRATLVDADPASNAANWQWVAGCGTDAAPFFRVFNPVLQGQKFDPSGTFIRKWVPELAGLRTEWIHSPWTAPAEALAAAGVRLGVTYPAPLVDHAAARRRALAAFAQIRGRTA